MSPCFVRLCNVAGDHIVSFVYDEIGVITIKDNNDKTLLIGVDEAIFNVLSDEFGVYPLNEGDE